MPLVAEIENEFTEENNPLNIHYDASKEIRAKGAGFYRFSADEEIRQRQMEGLKNACEETGKTRADFGAVDLRPGEVEGMQIGSGACGSGGGGTGKGMTLEKRRRDLEEGMRLVDAKRRKKVGKPPTIKPPSDSSLPTTDSQGERLSKPQSVKAVAWNPADDFLVQLERDIMSGRARWLDLSRVCKSLTLWLRSLYLVLAGPRSPLGLRFPDCLLGWNMGHAGTVLGILSNY